MSPIHVLPNFQISENSDMQILGYRITNERMNKRDSLGLIRLRRETKIDQILGKKGHFLIFRLQRLGLVQKISKL